MKTNTSSTPSTTSLGFLHAVGRLRSLSHPHWHSENACRQRDKAREDAPPQPGNFLLVSAALGCVALSLLGCASTGTVENRTAKTFPPANPTPSVAEAPFEAPHDPSMGQIVVAVPEVAVSAPVAVTAGNLGQLVRSQLAGYLSQSPNLLVADRETLTEIGQEHKLAERGAMDPRDKPVAGRLAGARYLIKVDVTDFKEDVVGKARGGRFETGGIFNLIGSFVPGEAATAMSVLGAINPTFGKAKETVRGIVGLELRIVDVDTGTVVKATRATGTLTRQNTRSVFGVAGFSMTDSSFSQSVVAQAMRSATQDSARQIHAALRERVLASALKIAIPIQAGASPVRGEIAKAAEVLPAAK
jgi:curli biogenesis system outer membrane secretion channel CsgG